MQGNRSTIFLHLEKPNTSSEARANIELNQYMAQDRNRTQATLVGGESFRHCAIPTPGNVKHEGALSIDVFEPRTSTGSRDF